MTQPSLSLIKARARARVARLQSRAQQAAKDNQRRIEQRIRALTCNGKRSLTKAQVEQLARESTNYLRNRLK